MNALIKDPGCAALFALVAAVSLGIGADAACAAALGSASLAAYLPARRAARVDPTISLRSA